MILRTGTRKIIEYDFCPHREYLNAVSHKKNRFSKLAPLLQVLSERGGGGLGQPTFP